MKEKMIAYILTQAPIKFGKENWLGLKTSPHQPMIFINEIDFDGVTTNQGYYTWKQCTQETISTIYQRLKLNETIPNK